MRIRTLSDVVRWRMCTGCGFCAGACDRNAVTMVDAPDRGLEPRFHRSCDGCTKCLEFCPGYRVDDGLPAPPDPQLGPVLDLWEGHAADPAVRRMASSGGVLTALAAYCIEAAGMSGALHTGMDPGQPWRNRTFFSTDRAQLLSRCGSRYSPAAPGEGLRRIEEAEGLCVFIGRPEDVTALQALRRIRPELDRRVGLVASFFCAGTPATNGTLAVLRELEVPADDLSSLRYRGDGWPGEFAATRRSNGSTASLPYEEAWRRLVGHKPLRANLIVDPLGWSADVSCGDAWHVPHDGPDPGTSVVIVRTETGRALVNRARAAGCLSLRPARAEDIRRGQANLLASQSETHGRIMAMRLFGIPATTVRGFGLRASWRRVPWRRKLACIGGTVRRILRRRLRRPLPIST
jgi:coenzyme F420 hydrogenase subunit beta